MNKEEARRWFKRAQKDIEDAGLKSLQDLKRLVDFIASEYKPEKIILYGSYGTDVERKSSDIDLLIIKKTRRRFVERVVELTQLIRSQFVF